MGEKKKRTNWGQHFVSFLYFVVGILGAVVAMRYSWLQHLDIYGIIFVLLGVYAALYIEVLIHEAGHLVFGLLSGYKFVSFRVFGLLLLKQKGRLKLKRFYTPGLAGQCLMAPPDMVDGKVPVFLYNMGGALMDLIFASVCLAVFFSCGDVFLLSPALLIMALVGLLNALTNGIPLRFEYADNDGLNAISLGKDPEAMRAFWIQLKVNESTANGVRLKDMPEEWFKLPPEDSMRNSLVTTLAVFAESRLMDIHDYDGARELVSRLLEMDEGLAGLHQNLLACEAMFLELIGENRKDKLLELRTDKQLKFIQSMKNSPTVIRTEYAYALLKGQNKTKASSLIERFNRRAGSYPYQGDIESERENMRFAYELYEERYGGF